MGFTIGGTFDHLFGHDAVPNNVDYDQRRWFRRAGSSGEEAEVTKKAETQLVSHVDGATMAWAKTNGCVGAATFDRARHLPPRTPYDVFAISAYLIEQAGVYHHIQPQKISADGSRKLHVHDSDVRHIDITAADRRLVAEAATAWRALDMRGGSMIELARQIIDNECWKRIAPLFESWWFLFSVCADDDVGERPENDGKPALPRWWKHAWRLFAIADEAAAGTGFILDVNQLVGFLEGEDTEMLWFEAEVLFEHVIRLDQIVGQSLGKDSAEESQKAEPESLAKSPIPDIQTFSAASTAVLSVMPKVRTPMVGCTLRSLSHHLALLPPTGIVRAGWIPNYRQTVDEPGSMPHRIMNLLLVPLPYSLGARSFEKALVEDVSDSMSPVDGKRPRAPRFGYFDIKQDWLDLNKLRKFLVALVEAARRQSGEIHGLVFPELALDYATYQAVRDEIVDAIPEAEVLIAGLATNKDGRKGNFVATSTFPSAGNPSGLMARRDSLREKHHRWKLDRTQLETYGLLGVLSPEISWWENISLQARQVNFTVMRRDSVFAAMICEDLARVDPCQQVIRAVGPNLIVALLMDAPQIESRWPARYATVLSEDPGCAALTLTSRGLMTLQHRLGTHRSNGDDRIIGLWRDDAETRPIALKCPYDAQAILLTIVEKDVEDVALDGRVDNDAKAWRYVGNVPIRVDNAKKDHGDVLGAEDIACW
jgi:hypothetical protein